MVVVLETMRKRVRLFYAKQVQHPLNGIEVLAHIFKANSFLQSLWYPSRVPFLRIDPECALSALVSDIFHH